MQDHRKLPRAVVKGLANLLPSRNVGSVARSADHPTGTQENGSTASPRFSPAGCVGLDFIVVSMVSYRYYPSVRELDNRE